MNTSKGKRPFRASWTGNLLDMPLLGGTRKIPGGKALAPRLALMFPSCLIIALLAGCATVPQTPLVSGVKTEVVKVAVNVRCVSLSELPAIPKTRLDPEKQNLEQMIIAIQLDFNNLEDYVVIASALLKACATEPEKTQ